MNLGDTYLEEGFANLVDVQGTTFKTLDNIGAVFSGTINEAPPVDPEWELGSDLRSLSTLEVKDPPANLNLNVKFGVLNGQVLTGIVWRIVKLDGNPADFTQTFWVVQVTGSDR